MCERRQRTSGGEVREIRMTKAGRASARGTRWWGLGQDIRTEEDSKKVRKGQQCIMLS